MSDLTTVEAVKAWLQDPNGEVNRVAVTDGGTGYHAATTTVSLSGVVGPGSGLVMIPEIVGGVVKSVVVLNQGKLYLKGTPPVVAFTDSDMSPGSGAAASLDIAEIQSPPDAQIARLVTAASEFFYQKTSRAVLIGPVTVTEKHNGHSGQRYIQTVESPITAVTSLTLDGLPSTVSAGPMQPGYGFDPDGIFLRGTSFTDGYSNVVIVYTAGYASGSPELAMIEQAVIVLAGTWFKRRLHMDENSRAVNASGSITVSYSTKDCPPEVQTVIQKFQRPMLFG
jgi:hypothetical protein